VSASAKASAGDVLPAGLEAQLGPPESAPVPLGGGITNHNLRVRYGGRDVVVRLAGRDTDLLGIDRACERDATAGAAAVGVGPRVLAYLEDPPTLVTEFLPGRVMTQADLGKPDMIAEIAVTLWEVHGIRPLSNRFSAWDVVEEYARTASERGGGVPGQFGDLLEGARRIQGAIDPAHPEHAPVPCHNDLLPANLIYDGQAMRIVDWEYAGMGNRYFDLGNLSVNSAFNEAGDEWLLECYWGEPCTRGRLATLRLMRNMSDLREAMWGVVQRAISELDFDFAEYAQEHFERVRAGFADPRFDVWLEDARRGA
jgi:thiamine kinase-like enzyme